MGPWTPNLVLCAKIGIFRRRPVLFGGIGKLQPALLGDDGFLVVAEDDMTRLLAVSESYFGRANIKRIALLTKARSLAGGASQRQMCQARYRPEAGGWRHSREWLRVQAHCAEDELATELNRLMVPVPKFALAELATRAAHRFHERIATDNFGASN